MTVPYYQDDLVTLYLGDCLEVTAWLAADYLATDPPYGRGWTGGSIGTPPHGGIIGDKDTRSRDDALVLWGDKVGSMFGDLMIVPPLNTRQVLIYRKPGNAGIYGARAGFRRDVEAIYLVGGWSPNYGGLTSVVETRVRSSASYSGSIGHPHAKPGDVMSLLVGLAPGVVADPFAGSGSTLVAAKALGRRSIGVEIDEKYCEIAARRLSQGVLDFGEPLLEEVM